MRWGAEHVADLEALRGHWQLDRLTVVGYSWGGLLALLYALEHPDRIARLALVSSAPVTAAWRDEFERRFAGPHGPAWIARSRADLVASGLSRTDPEKYRAARSRYPVAGYFRDRAARGNDPVSRHRADAEGRLGQPWGITTCATGSSELSERYGSPSLLLARRLRPHAPRSRRETAALLSTA